MKKSIITIILALASVIIAAAQSTNPLNYSGRMYVEAIEIIDMSLMRTTPSCHSKCASPRSKSPSAIWTSRKVPLP